MIRTLLSGGLAAFMSMALLPAVGMAQQASGIAGEVRDASGAILPGVTVEATSSVLIEKVRTAVTDSEGLYKIIDLRPGTYVVTFGLTGFSTVKREGIELRAGFTGTVNAEMHVGALEETLTVIAASPLVDTQSTRTQMVITKELLDALPTGLKSLGNLIVLTPALTGAADVGGSAGAYRGMGSPQSVKYHGKTGMKVTYDDMAILNASSTGTVSYIINAQVVEEMTLQSGGISAESAASGFAANAVAKEGANTFKFSVSGLYTNENLQSNNLTDALRARGLTTVDSVVEVYDVGGTFGGPLKSDTLWFFGAVRAAGNENRKAGIFWNKTQGTPFYTPDPARPASRIEYDRFFSGRVTWQASTRNKVNFFTDFQNVCRCVYEGNEAPEASFGLHFLPQSLSQVTWRSPVTNKLLFEAGVSVLLSKWETPVPEGTSPNVDLSILELRTNFRYNAPFRHWYRVDDRRYVQRFAVSYVTGSHFFKTGLQVDEGIWNTGTGIESKVGFGGERIVGNISYRFLDGRPNGLTQYATPNLQRNTLKADLGIFAQDQWTIRRLTLNYGVRFDYFNGYVPEQHAPAGPFVPERSFAAVHDVPNWTDLNPRLGAAYNLFGDGKTALKASVGRYVNKTATAIAAAVNPLVTSVNEVNRNWTDTNLNYFPDCNLANPALNGECGPYLNQNFGQVNIATRYSDDLLRGFGVREYNWDFTAEVQHQLLAGMSVTAGYYRNWFGNFSATDNLEVIPSDYSQYCVTAPRDPRLPNGGGYQVCGLYDVSLAKVGRSNNLVTQASDFRKRTQVSDFFGVTFNTRFGSGTQFGGGMDLGRTVTDNCFVIDSPQQLLNCHVVSPFKAQMQVKLFGSYQLPFELMVSGTLQNQSGPEILATYTAPNSAIAPTLGRNLASCGAAAVCNGTAPVPLIAPQTMFEDRRTQLDLRLSKFVRLGRKLRLQANFDVYNALNASSLLGINTAYGAQWRFPVTSLATGAGVLDGRLVEFSGQLTF
jgi:hypothetical protein